jgi:hypothetical protein
VAHEIENHGGLGRRDAVLYPLGPEETILTSL